MRAALASQVALALRYNVFAHRQGQVLTQIDRNIDQDGVTASEPQAKVTKECVPTKRYFALDVCRATTDFFFSITAARRPS